MKTQRFDFNFRPFAISLSLLVEGNVADHQEWEGVLGYHFPDYTLTNLVLQPVAMLSYGGSDVTDAGVALRVNAQLANVKWKVADGSTEREVTASEGTIDRAETLNGQPNDQKGRLLWKRNVQPSQPVSLVFEADYLDPRTGGMQHLRATHLITCSNATQPEMRIELPHPDVVYWDPLRNRYSNFTLEKAHLMVDGVAVMAGANLQWVVDLPFQSDNGESLLSNNFNYSTGYSYFSTDFIAPYRLPTPDVRFNVYARYHPQDYHKTPTSKRLPKKEMRIIRRIAPIDYTMVSAPYNLPEGQGFIFPEIRAWDTHQHFTENVLKYVFLPLWYKVDKDGRKEIIDHGFHPMISTSFINEKKVLGYDMHELSGLAVMVVKDGSAEKALCDGGNYWMVAEI